MLQLNGFAETDYRLYHGVAGPRPGKAIFPAPAKGEAHWGGAPVLYPGPEQLAEAEAAADRQVLDVMTLQQLGEGEPIDLLHIDIQGGEADYVIGNTEDMMRLVRRVLIGTHSRAVEGRLCSYFLGLGWRMEMERPAITPLVQGRPETRIDGVQMWANPALA